MSTPISAEDLAKLAKALKEAKPEIKSEQSLKDACKGIMGKQWRLNAERIFTMGCDIHSFIEVKKNGKWEHYNWRDEKYLIGTYDDGSPQYSYDGYFDDPLYIGRNYDLFAILANVRNGRGFAGIKTSEGFEPMDMPRGLPVDVTAEVAKQSDDWDSDGHSHSWFLLSDLLSYDYDKQGTTQYGVVNSHGYQEFKEKGKPSMYSGDVSGSRVRHISNLAMDEVLAGSELGKIMSEEFSLYTRVEWHETYRDAVGEHWFKTLEVMKGLSDKPEDVRLVFWFDN